MATFVYMHCFLSSILLYLSYDGGKGQAGRHGGSSEGFEWVAGPGGGQVIVIPEMKGHHSASSSGQIRVARIPVHLLSKAKGFLRE